VLHAPGQARRRHPEAYHVHGVRTFSLDTVEELEKIVEATRDRWHAAADLSLCVRLRVSSEYSELSLASKFGVDLADAARCFRPPVRLPIAWHLLPRRFAGDDALCLCAGSGTRPRRDRRCRGHGGHHRCRRRLPSIYPGMEPPPLEDYFASIHRAFESLPVSYSSELWCEPGRALSAEFNSMIVQVEKRRGNELFINEGAYGALYDAAHVDWRFPVKRIERRAWGAMEEFAFYGPTCDDADYMEGPSSFPPTSSRATISRSACWAPMARRCARVSTALAPGTVNVTDEPMASQYCGKRRDPRVSDNVVSLR
jgi:ornithine decarboxylase